MEDFQVAQTLIIAGISTLVIFAVATVSQRLGSRFGAILSTIPIVTVIAHYSIGLSLESSGLTEAIPSTFLTASALVVAMGVAMAVYPRPVLLPTLSLWLIAMIAVVAVGDRAGLVFAAGLFYVLILITTYMARKFTEDKPSESPHPANTLRKDLLGAFLGGAIIVGASLASALVGGHIAGIIAALPVAITMSAFLIGRSAGRYAAVQYLARLVSASWSFSTYLTISGVLLSSTDLGVTLIIVISFITSLLVSSALTLLSLRKQKLTT